MRSSNNHADVHTPYGDNERTFKSGWTEPCFLSANDINHDVGVNYVDKIKRKKLRSKNER